MRNGRATHIPAESLETSSVSSRHHDLGVHVDALALEAPTDEELAAREQKRLLADFYAGKPNPAR